jgi:hypothetical protein
MSGIIAQNTLDNSGLIKAPEGGGAWNFISKQTASSDSTIDFTSGIDSTYKEYLFTFNNIHPSGDTYNFTVNFRDGGSAYDATKTSTYFQSYHMESDGEAGQAYVAGADLAQSTSADIIGGAIGSDNDQCCSGYLHLFDPSSTTFVKHYIGEICASQYQDYSTRYNFAGYCNVTAAIDGVQFAMSSGDIDTGDICLYGLTT